MAHPPEESEHLRSVEFHALSGPELLLLNVQTLELSAGSPLELETLRAAEQPTPIENIRGFLTTRGLSPEASQALIEELRAKNLLVRSLPDAAPLHEISSSHVTFMVNVAQRCNLTCDYCYVNEGLFDYAEKPIARMRKTRYEKLPEQILESFPGFETYCLHFYGGEPLLNFRAIDNVVSKLCVLAETEGFKTDFHITTNGTLLNRDIAEFMGRHRFTVYYSIDGEKEDHDAYRTYRNGEGSYDDVVRNYQLLRDTPGVHIIGSSVIRKDYSLDSALQTLEERGVNQCKAERVRLEESNPIALQGCSHDQYLADIDTLVDHYIDAITDFRKPIDFRLSSKILQLLTRTRREFFCPAGDRMFGISAAGEIHPCALHVGREQSLLGSLDEGLNTDKVAAFRKQYSPGEQQDCATCWNRHLCGGGCSAMVDRFGHEDCRALMSESEAAIKVYWHFAQRDPVQLLCLVSPDAVRWANNMEIENPEPAHEANASDRIPSVQIA